MPKIKNWSRDDDRGPLDSNAAWEHDGTGEILYLSHKVPNDGYYVMAVKPDDCPPGTGDGERIGYDHNKRQARRIATKKLRDNPDGFHDQDEEE